MRRVSASKAALLGACAFPFRDGSPWVDEKGRAAVMGDDFHQRIAPVVDVALPSIDRPVTTKWLRERLFHAGEWIAAHQYEDWRAEVAYAYDPQNGTGRVLGYNIGREYEAHGKTSHEIAGSADIAWTSGDVVYVRDWKTGRTVGPSADAQLEWLGLFAARAAGKPCVDVAALHVTDYGVSEESRALLEDVDLWRIAEQIRIDTNAIEDAWPVTGAHCDAMYCPARAGCHLYQLNRRESA